MRAKERVMDAGRQICRCAERTLLQRLSNEFPGARTGSIPYLFSCLGSAWACRMKLGLWSLCAPRQSLGARVRKRGVCPLLRACGSASERLSMVAVGLNPRLRGSGLSRLPVFCDDFIRKAFQSDVDVALPQGVDVNQQAAYAKLFVHGQALQSLTIVIPVGGN